MNEKEPILILIDTSTSSCSVALARGTKPLRSLVEPHATGKHAELAGVMVEQITNHLQAEGLSPDAIVVSSGPGSYTGLRIGSSLAKGLCFGYGIPLIAVSTLETMVDAYLAQTTVPTDALVHPMIDARRMEVYTASFNAGGSRLSDDRPIVLEETCYLEDAKQAHHFVGDGAHKVSNLWPGLPKHLAPEIRPEAQYMVGRAMKAWSARQFVDLAYWTPNYLKEYVATVARNKVLG